MAKAQVPVPKFSEEKPYERYKTEVEVWSKVCDVEKSKHGMIVALSLPEDSKSEIRDKVFSELDTDTLNGEGGLKALLEYLDTQFGKDDLSETYERYINFERCKRGTDQGVNDFILEYEKKYKLLAKKEGATFTNCILAMKLVDSSNLSEVDRKLVLSGMDYEKKDQLFKQSKVSLRKFVGDQASAGTKDDSSQAIKLETFIAEHEDALIANGWQRFKQIHKGRGRSNSLPLGVGGGGGNKYRRDDSPYRRDQSPYNKGDSNNNNNYRRDDNQQPRKNPIGRDGKIKRCFVCNSTDHMITDCPKNNGNKLEISLFAGNDHGEIVLLAKETWDSAVLDSGCTSTVCGEQWIEDFLERLRVKSDQSISRVSSNKVFHFGGGEKLHSKGSLKFPCLIAGQPVTINTDVVESNIPLLLSIKAMKKAGMVWDFKQGTIEVFGKVVQLHISSCGHHSIPIIISEISVKECALIAFDSDDPVMVHKWLKFLHLQFAHPPKDKFIDLLNNAGSWKDQFRNTLNDIYEKCRTCAVFQKTPSRPVVCMPEAEDFCDLVVMDLKKWGNMHLLHIIDAFSRFSVSVAIKSKTPQMVSNQFLLKWVGAGYGLCKRLKFDNGGEFNNDEMREVSDCLGMEIKTTGAESPWQNGLCERNHAVTDRCLEKIMDENPKIELEIALAYACNAKNSLQMWNGYSSYQIVFGTNPKLPDIFHATPPQLEGRTQSEILAKHLNVLQSARKGFIESQCDEKVRRALRHKLRSKLETYVTGDRVYYKRDDSNRWRGPGIVIGQDRQVVFVRHGGVYVRVSTCRLKKVHSSDKDEVEDEPNNNEMHTPAENISENKNNQIESDNLEDAIIIDETSSIEDDPVVENQGKHVRFNIGDEEDGHVAEDNPNVENPCDNIKLKKGDHVRFKIGDEEDWHVAEITGPDGKVNSIRKWYNVKEGDKEFSIHVDRVKQLQVEEQEAGTTTNLR